MKSLIISIVLLFLANTSSAQSDFFKQQTEYAIYNIGLNGLVSGIGSVVNKKADQKIGKAFWRGFKHGSIGGTFILLGKQATFRINEQNNLGYGWVAKMSTSIGSSITQNAMSNRHFWERWHLNLPMIRTEYDFLNKRFRARIKLSNIATLAILGRQAQINWGRSLSIGALYFEKEGPIKYQGIYSRGLAVFDGFAVDTRTSNAEMPTLVAHEMMHVIQCDSNAWINPFFNSIDKKWKSDSKVYNTLSKIFYFDFNAGAVWASSLAGRKKNWECRFMEREADHFSAKRIWPGCN